MSDINKIPKDDSCDDGKANEAKTISFSGELKHSITSFIDAIQACLSTLSKYAQNENEHSESSDDLTHFKTNVTNIQRAMNKFRTNLNKITKHQSIHPTECKDLLNNYYKMQFKNELELQYVIQSWGKDAIYKYANEIDNVSCNLIGVILVIIYMHNNPDDEENKKDKNLVIKCLELLDYLLNIGVNPTINPFPANELYGNAQESQVTKQLTAIYHEWQKNDTEKPYQHSISEGDKSCGFRTIYHLSAAMKTMFTPKEITQKILHIINYSFSWSGEQMKPALISFFPQNTDQYLYGDVYHPIIFFGGFWNDDPDKTNVIPPFEAVRELIWSDCSILEGFEYYNHHYSLLIGNTGTGARGYGYHSYQHKFPAFRQQKWRKQFLLTHWNKIPKKLIKSFNKSTCNWDKKTINIIYEYCPTFILIREMIKDIRCELLDVLKESLRNIPHEIINEIYSNLIVDNVDYNYLYDNFKSYPLIKNCLEWIFEGGINWIKYFVDKICLSPTYKMLFQNLEVTFRDKSGHNATDKFVNCLLTETNLQIVNCLLPLYRGQIDKKSTVVLINKLMEKHKLLKAVLKCEYYKKIWFEHDMLINFMKERKPDDKTLNIIIHLLPTMDRSGWISLQPRYKLLMRNIFANYKVKNEEINLFINTAKLLKILNKKKMKAINIFGLLFAEGNIEFFDFLKDSNCFDLQIALKEKDLDSVFQQIIPRLLVPDWNEQIHSVLLVKILELINNNIYRFRYKRSLIKRFFTKWVHEAYGRANCEKWYKLLLKYQTEMTQKLYPPKLINDDDHAQKQNETKQLFTANQVTMKREINKEWKNVITGDLELLFIKQKRIEITIDQVVYIPVKGSCKMSSNDRVCHIDCYHQNDTPIGIKHSLQFNTEDIKQSFVQCLVKNITSAFDNSVVFNYIQRTNH